MIPVLRAREAVLRYSVMAGVALSGRVPTLGDVGHFTRYHEAWSWLTKEPPMFMPPDAGVEWWEAIRDAVFPGWSARHGEAHHLDRDQPEKLVRLLQLARPLLAIDLCTILSDERRQGWKTRLAVHRGCGPPSVRDVHAARGTEALCIDQAWLRFARGASGGRQVVFLPVPLAYPFDLYTEEEADRERVAFIVPPQGGGTSVNMLDMEGRLEPPPRTRRAGEARHRAWKEALLSGMEPNVREVHENTSALEPWAADELQRLGWQVKGDLGRGAFGVVVEASLHGEVYAVKVLDRTPHGGDRRKLAERLRRLSERLRGVVGVVGYPELGRNQPEGALVMNKVSGLTLDRWLARDPAEEVRRQVASALIDCVRRVHEKGVSHRDLHPRNVIVSEGDQPVLIDFGFARPVAGWSASLRSSALQRGWGVAPYAPKDQLQGLVEPSEWFAADVHAVGWLVRAIHAGALPIEKGGSWTFPRDRTVPRWVEEATRGWCAERPADRPADGVAASLDWEQAALNVETRLGAFVAGEWRLQNRLVPREKDSPWGWAVRERDGAVGLVFTLGNQSPGSFLLERIQATRPPTVAALLDCRFDPGGGRNVHVVAPPTGVVHRLHPSLQHLGARAMVVLLLDCIRLLAWLVDDRELTVRPVDLWVNRKTGGLYVPILRSRSRGADWSQPEWLKLAARIAEARPEVEEVRLPDEQAPDWFDLTSPDEASSDDAFLDFLGAVQQRLVRRPVVEERQVFLAVEALDMLRRLSAGTWSEGLRENCMDIMERLSASTSIWAGQVAGPEWGLQEAVAARREALVQASEVRRERLDDHERRLADARAESKARRKADQVERQATRRALLERAIQVRVERSGDDAESARLEEEARRIAVDLDLPPAYLLSLEAWLAHHGELDLLDPRSQPIRWRTPTWLGEIEGGKERVKPGQPIVRFSLPPPEVFPPSTLTGGATRGRLSIRDLIQRLRSDLERTARGVEEDAMDPECATAEAHAVARLRSLTWLVIDREIAKRGDEYSKVALRRWAAWESPPSVIWTARVPEELRCLGACSLAALVEENHAPGSGLDARSRWASALEAPFGAPDPHDSVYDLDSVADLSQPRAVDPVDVSDQIEPDGILVLQDLRWAHGPVPFDGERVWYGAPPDRPLDRLKPNLRSRGQS